jgi:type III restriction enzyme
MTFLYEKLDVLRQAGSITPVSQCIFDGLNDRIELRAYQKEAFENFITYFENNSLRERPTQTLFHMATGSGKTVIMAGLLLYMYEQGYRNFVFFVNTNNILTKTEENFLKESSSKYLFSNIIVVNHAPVKIKKVDNFDEAEADCINICFTSIQKLHLNMLMPEENSMTMDDFQNKEVVLIADEAHHLNATTKKKKLGEKKELEVRSWEDTVKGILHSNPNNVLLEFTATCDVKNNENIRREYENKIVYNYPLLNYRLNGYSKEIKSLRTDVTLMERSIQALLLSQYRLKVFQDNRIQAKPVVLFKSAKVADSEAFYAEFQEKMKTLSRDEIARIFALTDDEVLQEAKKYFEQNEISFDNLASELRDSFSEEHCLVVNGTTITPEKQSFLNNLEDINNPYRAIFEVKVLDEGWDVLNLFDIVRLYETRQSGGKAISPATISEAQLIGRGARYFPFKVADYQDRYKRKYDNDITNELRVCEEMFYHCHNDSRYLGELENALKEIGLEIDRKIEKSYVLKDEFKNSDIFKSGRIFLNSQKHIGREDAQGLLDRVKGRLYSSKIRTRLSKEDRILVLIDKSEDTSSLVTNEYKIKDIAAFNYAIVIKALNKYQVFAFNVLKNYYPALESTREFITSPNFLGDIRIGITTAKVNEGQPIVFYEALLEAFDSISAAIEHVEELYEGTKEFYPEKISNVFKDKKMMYTEHDHDHYGAGVAQSDPRVPKRIRLDLSQEEWYACEENYGTSEEKECTKYLSGVVNKLKEKYDDVYFIRNEKHFAIYSFSTGERFEPDYVLMLRANGTDGYEQIQIFIEPKGHQLLKDDSWKEEFLLQIKSLAVPVFKFQTPNKYNIWGFHFYNAGNIQPFAEDMDNVINRG